MYTGVSSEYESVINAYSRRFAARLKKNGQIIDATVRTYSLRKYSSSGEDFSIGCAFSAAVEIACITDANLKDQEISLETGLYTDSGCEYVPDGIFTITSAKKKNDTTTLIGYDRMCTAGSAIFQVTQFPEDLSVMAAEVAEQMGTAFDASCLSLADDIQITVLPENCTLQNLAGYLAGLLGRNAYIDRSGKLTFRAYTETDYEFDGNRISDIDVDSTARNINYLQCTTTGDAETLQSGSGTGYIRMQNPLMTQNTLDKVTAKISGFSYYGAVVPFLLGDNRLDPWDIIFYKVKRVGDTSFADENNAILTDEYGNVFTDLTEEKIKILCHEIILNFDGGLKMDVTSYALSETEENGYRGPLQLAIEEIKKTTAESVKTVSITADTYVFKYAAETLVGADKANLTAVVQNVTIDRWQYLDADGLWADYPMTVDNNDITSSTLIVRPEHPVFVRDTVQIKLVTSDLEVYDTLTITKLSDGDNGADGTGGLSIILGNEAQTIACNADGAVLEETVIEIPFTGYIGIEQTTCSCNRVGTLPSGVTIVSNTAGTATTAGSIIFKFAEGATLSGASNGTIDLEFTIGGSKVTKQFSWSKSNAGKDGSSKTLYTWIKYADTPTSGMSDNPDGKAYMGIAYNKETQTESTDYNDYTWSKTEGKQGVPGESGYTWVKYADDGNGSNMSDDPEGKEYIGLAYNKPAKIESTDPADYQWSKFRGDDGVPGRTYILESSVEIVKKGANNILSPGSITFSAYYRDGDAVARTEYAGRFKIYESTTDTSTWSLKYASGSNQSSKIHTLSNNDVKFIKCILCAAGGTTTEMVSVTISVIEDAEGAVDEIDKMLTQKEIFNRLTNNGQAQGMYYDESTGDLYINASYIVSGILASIDQSSWIKLEDGSFSLANGQMIYDPETGVLKITGTLVADGQVVIRKEGCEDTTIAYEVDDIADQTTWTNITESAEYKDGKVSFRVRQGGGSIGSDNTPGGPVDTSKPLHFLRIATQGLKVETIKTNEIDGQFIFGTDVAGEEGYFQALFATVLNAATAYFRDLVYMGKDTDNEKFLYFTNKGDGTYAHNSRLYGGSGSSKTAIGLYDEKNDRAIWRYNDVDNEIDTAAVLKHTNITISPNSAYVSAISGTARAYPFLKEVRLSLTLTLKKAIPAGTNVTIATIPSGYRPLATEALRSWAIGILSNACVYTSGSIVLKTQYEVASGNYVIIGGTIVYK